MTHPIVRRPFACPVCHHGEGFITKVRLEDYVEVENERNRCSQCRYTLTEAEAESMTEAAWYSQYEDYADQRDDALYDRAKDRSL